jgi:molybdenum cofactor synthesis domain-containing protein
MIMNKNSACILLIGNELLNGDTRDKNAWYLALKLAEIGIKLENCSVVADNLTQIVSELDRLSKLSPLIFTCGGIGPTSDDMTREAISRLVGVELEQRAEAVEKLNNYAASQNSPLNQK